MMKGIFLLLGSNLGDKEKILKAACSQINSDIGQIVKESAIYETSAWGITVQPSFYNQVIEVLSELSASELLARINHIESVLGRVRTEKWGARIIDIDILYYGHEIIATTNLTVPHPAIPERRFTLVPLVELAPDFIHPVLNKPNWELLRDCPDKLGVRKLEG